MGGQIDPALTPMTLAQDSGGTRPLKIRSLTLTRYMTSAVLTDIGLGKCERDIDREQVLLTKWTDRFDIKMPSKHDADAIPATAGTPMGTSGTTPTPTPSHRRSSSSGISDDAAQSAHDFMSGTIRRSSSGVTDDVATAAHDFMHHTKGTGPGLTDDLTDKAHKFMDGPATHRESHSKYVPDVTIPGLTDQILEEALEFEDNFENEKMGTA
ncbi:hypothetical protein LTR47_006906 [Exophiala xenobiotica]|nr:hypothetical protein LTR47_006906 [Exophiala xenobiotica]KAK5259290.1 hypothetical protein LTR40_006260 [Exophiala xenobiotica]KAK5374935.1 hypothetical protein LTS13_005504 [Exophiala xenobiotica]KAK5397086.1 hypothetical protein LTR79_005723 [Exophiala xenobiotica]KAK5470965.1 hypothetical protein LTR20_001227 [Exophiala xenobiotica]